METVLVLLWTAWRVEEMGRLEEPDRVPRPSACAGGALAVHMPPAVLVVLGG